MKRTAPWIKDRLREIRTRFAPGSSMRSFARVIGVPDNTYLGWESKGHAPAEAVLAASLARVPGLTEALARSLAAWALADSEAPMPSPPGPSGGGRLVDAIRSATETVLASWAPATIRLANMARQSGDPSEVASIRDEILELLEGVRQQNSVVERRSYGWPISPRVQATEAAAEQRDAA